MHRHSYQGKKLSLKRGPRQALVRGQLTSLVLYEQITTTEAKAKEVAPQFERLVTRAKERTLAGGRALREVLLTENAVQKMVQELEPAWRKRSGGYTRIIHAGHRRGDNAPMAVLSLVLPEKAAKETKAATVTDVAAPEPKATEAEPKPAAKRTRAKAAATEPTS